MSKKKAAASDDVVESSVVETPAATNPVRENGRATKAPQTGPRNQPKKNTPRSKRKK